MPIPSNSSKRVKIYHPSHNENNGGAVYVLGTGDMGQLGLGGDNLEAKRPVKVPNLPINCIQVAAGGVHSACLTKDGKVFTWGCNDDGALGRLSEETSDLIAVIGENSPDRVKGLIEHVKIVQISCGDSHTAALTDDGNVYIWGTFRNLNGNIGLIKEKCTERFPIQLKFKYTIERPIITKIASGNNHLCCLSSDGRVFTFGNWEQGQLGRDYLEELEEIYLFEKNIEDSYFDDTKLIASNDDDDDETNINQFDIYLKPYAISISNYIKFDDCWAGSYCTFARAKRTKQVFACGLNNYMQLNIDPLDNDVTKNENLIVKEFTQWKGIPLSGKTHQQEFIVSTISSAEHHTFIGCTNGSLFSLGRHDYGRLGLGKERKQDAIVPELSPIFNTSSFNNKKLIKVATGAATALAISSDYKLYGWGMHDSYQIPFKEDVYEPQYIPTHGGECIDASVGAQHSLLIIRQTAG